MSNGLSCRPAVEKNGDAQMPPYTRRIVRGRVAPPPLGPSLVTRPRLEEEIRRLIEDYRTVMVMASAGAGKTTAVLQAARRTGRPLAWLSVDGTDADTGHLLVYLEAALATQLPEMEGVATAAMSAGLPHIEVAALLAEEIGDGPLLLVVDDLERLASAQAALDVLSNFARFMPETARLVLVGRRDVAIDLGSDAIGAVAGIGEGELAFTEEEAAAALKLANCPDVDPAAALEATGGWVAGVLFEAWRSAEHVPGMGGEADPLHGYLASQILGDLPADEHDFLVITSVLDHVTAQRATALGVPDAGPTMRGLRRRHLPVSWQADSAVMRCHPRFREYLLELLSRRPSAAVLDVRRRYGKLLIATGHYEEAVRELLAGDAPESALVAAEHCLEAVVERGDVRLAREWLDALAPAHGKHPSLAAAELMIAVAGEDYRSAVTLADELRLEGELEELVRSSARAGALLSWAHMHVGKLAEANEILAMTPRGHPRDAMRYCLSMMEDRSPTDPPPHLSGASFDALVMRCHYYRGDFQLAQEHALSGWAERVGESWRIGALLDTGHTEEALRLLRAATAAGEKGAWFSGVLTVRVMCRLGDLEAARAALESGRARILATGSSMLELFSHVEEAQLELRLTGDLDRADAALARVLGSPMIDNYAFVREQALTLLGLAELRREKDESAAAHLRTAVEASLRSDRFLALPQAGIYLAEAEWRLGDPDAADRAADSALEGARRQGSNYLLLEALDDFPAVLSRRLDAEASLDSAWHAVARDRLAQPGDGGRAVSGAAIVLTEFGELAITVEGRRTKPRIKKSYELLAFLVSKGTESRALRAELLGVLFEGRSDSSALAYLRQTVHHLRLALPDDALLTEAGGVVSLARPITSDSTRLQCLVAEAQTLRGAARLEGLRAALRIPAAGEYLPGVDSAWVEDRRAELQQLVTAARFAAAEAAYELERLSEAQDHLAQVLTSDPYREPAWRLAMRLADAVGDEAGVLEAYRGCERALKDLDAAPSATTRQLLHRLRR
jgi:ATP/maltotriose-dependent transcriptional regulator MalT/DNA-binding SARP family transcriptional activator